MIAPYNADIKRSSKKVLLSSRLPRYSKKWKDLPSLLRNGLIHEFSDSQFGHIFAHGHDRESARRAMVVALKELEIRGEMRTTVEYAIRMLESDDYIHDRISTQWLDARIAHPKELKHLEAKSMPPCLVAGFKHFDAARTGFLDSLRIGQVPAKDAIIKSEKIELIYENIKYTMKCSRGGPNSVIISNDIQSEEVSIRLMSDGGYLLNIKGRRRRCTSNGYRWSNIHFHSRV